MPSSYSTDLKLELMVTGENAGTWGDNTNNNLNLIQQAIAGYEAVALTDGGTVALAMTDKTISNARNMVIKFTGTLTTASTVTIPNSIEKFYIFDLSAVTGVTNLTIKTVSGTGFTAGEAAIVAAYSDGTNLNEIALNTLGGTIATAQINDNAITTAKISDNQITTAKISDNQITTAKISDNQITTAKIANDAVGPDQLSDTAVTPGEYSTATITVDQQGRVTAAAAGSAGSVPYLPAKAATSGSGTYNKNNPAANKVGVYLSGGGGGGGGGMYNGSGGSGGFGGFGFFNFAFGAPGTFSYSVGGGGNGGGGGPSNGNGSPGGAGGATNFSTGTANGGNGGAGAPRFSPGSSGNPGSVSGHYADLTSVRNAVFGSPISFGNGGGGGGPTQPVGNPGSSGNPGYFFAYENAESV